MNSLTIASFLLILYVVYVSLNEFSNTLTEINNGDNKNISNQHLRQHSTMIILFLSLIFSFMFTTYGNMEKMENVLGLTIHSRVDKLQQLVQFFVDKGLWVTNFIVGIFGILTIRHFREERLYGDTYKSKFANKIFLGYSSYRDRNKVVRISWDTINALELGVKTMVAIGLYLTATKKTDTKIEVEVEQLKTYCWRKVTLHDHDFDEKWTKIKKDTLYDSHNKVTLEKSHFYPSGTAHRVKALKDTTYTVICTLKN